MRPTLPSLRKELFSPTPDFSVTKPLPPMLPFSNFPLAQVPFPPLCVKPPRGPVTKKPVMGFPSDR